MTALIVTEGTDVTSQYSGLDGVVASGGGPRYRVMSSAGRRGRLRPLISRRTRLGLVEIAGTIPRPADTTKPDDKLAISGSMQTEHQPGVLERGTTFTSSIIAPDCCGAPSAFQLHTLPLNLSASTSGSDLELVSPASKSSETTYAAE